MTAASQASRRQVSGSSGQGPPASPPRPAGVAEEAVQVDGDQQLGPDPTGVGELAGFQVAAGQFGEGVGPTLATAAGVVGVVGRANGSRAASSVWPASGSSRPLTATMPSQVDDSHTPAADAAFGLDLGAVGVGHRAQVGDGSS